MAFRVTGTSYNDFVISRPATSRCSGAACSLAKPLAEYKQHTASQASELRHLSMANVLSPKFNFYGDSLWGIHGQPIKAVVPQRSIVCHSTHFRGTEEKQKTRSSDGQPEMSSVQIREKDEHQVMPRRIIHSNLALAEACKFVHNDAKFVNERARNDMVLLSRGIMRLDARVRKEVAILGSGFLKLDARAREDTEKIDRDMKAKAERLQHIASVLKDRAESKIKKAADKHWSDGALEADLRRADIRAKQRAMEDALMALELIKNIHDRMVNKMYEFRELGSVSGDGMLNFTDIKLEKNGMTGNFFPGEVSTDRITAIQNAYWSMASALSEADGIDYTDPEELELLVATLIDLDAMDGKSSVSLLAECSSSPDVGTRKALANALAAAPSMWTLGNAGMGALQRLAEDSNPSIAAAASRAIYELKKQWEIEEGDSWRFTMNIKPADQVGNPEDEGGVTDS